MEYANKSVKELVEERNTIAKVMSDFAVEINNATYTPEQEERWAKINTDYDAVTEALNKAKVSERALAVQTELNTIPAENRIAKKLTYTQNKREIGSEALRSFVHRNAGRKVSTEAYEAERDYLNSRAWCARDQLREGMFPVKLLPTQPTSAAEVRSMIQEQRDLSTGVGASGGYTVPVGFLRELEIALQSYAGALQVCRVWRTEGGNPFLAPMVDDIQNPAVIIGENATVSEVDMTFSQNQFFAYKFTSQLCRVANELMEDAAFNLESEIGKLLGIRLGRGLATYLTTGTGSGQPQGLVTALNASSSTKVQAANATSIVYNDILGLIASVNWAYRDNNPKCGFMAHDAIIWNGLRKIVDSNGRPLYQPGYMTGYSDAPEDRIHGYKIWRNQAMDSTMASGKNTLIFGDMDKFVIRMVNEIRFYRLNERYLDQDATGFVSFLRADSRLMDAGGHPLFLMYH